MRRGCTQGVLDPRWGATGAAGGVQAFPDDPLDVVRSGEFEQGARVDIDLMAGHQKPGASDVQLGQEPAALSVRQRGGGLVIDVRHVEHRCQSSVGNGGNSAAAVAGPGGNTSHRTRLSPWRSPMESAWSIVSPPTASPMMTSGAAVKIVSGC